MVSFSQLKNEFKKITWPAKKEVAKQSVASLILCALLALVISLYDLLFNWVLRGLEKVFIKG